VKTYVEKHVTTWSNKLQKEAEMLRIWHQIGFDSQSGVDGAKLAKQARGDSNSGKIGLWKSATTQEHRRLAVAQAVADVNMPRKYLMAENEDAVLQAVRNSGPNNGAGGAAKASPDRKAPENIEGNIEMKASGSSGVQNKEDKKSGSSSAANIIAPAPSSTLGSKKQTEEEKQPLPSDSSSSDDSTAESESDEAARQV
jgi:hypothetical protein